MMKGSRWSRTTAIHEAGHAVAMLRLTHGFHSAHVLPRGQTTMVDRKGRQVHCSGLVQGSSFNWDVLDVTRRAVEKHGGAVGLDALGHAYMTVDLCGPFAEARYRLSSQYAILVTGGSDDWASAHRIARWLWPDDEGKQNAAIDAAEREAVALVRTEWGLIIRVADVLATAGYIDMDHAVLAGEWRDAAPA